MGGNIFILKSILFRRLHGSVKHRTVTDWNQTICRASLKALKENKFSDRRDLVLPDLLCKRLRT
jgi:hypothetical protein